jgi:hypothetical protein
MTIMLSSATPGAKKQVDLSAAKMIESFCEGYFYGKQS